MISPTILGIAAGGLSIAAFLIGWEIWRSRKQGRGAKGEAPPGPIEPLEFPGADIGGPGL